jgi:hypothetical protein
MTHGHQGATPGHEHADSASSSSGTNYELAEPFLREGEDEQGEAILFFVSFSSKVSSEFSTRLTGPHTQRTPSPLG